MPQAPRPGSQAAAQNAEVPEQTPAAEDQANPQQQQQQQQPNGQYVPPPEPKIREYFHWRPVPWWVCFLLGIFFLTKLQVVYNDSPCAVLGAQSPVTSSEVKKAFRTISMCTHPDRLRGRLMREPTAAELRRGEIIFNRASAAKDELTTVMKRSGEKTHTCYQGELETAVWQFFKQAGLALGQLGIYDLFDMGWNLVWNVITFENGIFNTLLSCLWMAFFFRMFKQFVMYLWRLGLLRGVVALVTTIVIGPLPTLVHFIVLPVLRLVVFVKGVAAGFRSDSDTAPAAAAVVAPADDVGAAKKSDGPDATPEKEKKGPEKNEAAAALKKAREDLPKGVVKQRKKKETEEEKERKVKELNMGVTDAAAMAGVVERRPDPGNIWRCVTWTHLEPLKARQVAANAVQFDLLLILTKPIIPLFMLIAVGQVWNGLFSSLIIGHILRRWVPQMSYEAHHIFCMFFGVMHTLLGVSASQVEDYANREGTNLLHLRWAWSFKDVLAVMYMDLHGATVTAMASLGNEPSYAASFSAGIALRIALAQDSVSGLGFMQIATKYMQDGLRNLGVVLDAADEVVAYSGNGIGDCGGGAFRMLLGDGSLAMWTARFVKVWLMLLPALSAAQWLQRTFHAGRMLGKRRKLTRFLQRLFLAVFGIAQCILLAGVELNASNGALANFWVAMLFGCAGESLLSTYEVRTPVKQLVFLVLFLLI